MQCPDQIRLAEDFNAADRAWLACRKKPVDLRDEEEIYRLGQVRLDALRSRNAAAKQLYEHRVSCPICKNSRQERAAT
jgi:hypothetical protein